MWLKEVALFCYFSDHLAKKLIAFQAFSYLLFHLTFSKFYFEKVQSLGKMGRKVTFWKDLSFLSEKKNCDEK